MALRQFEILGLEESSDNEIEYKVVGLEYDPDKYDRIEQNIVVEAPVQTGLTGKLNPPTDFKVQPYSYAEGDQDVRKYGILISWVAADDPRAMTYELIGNFNGGGWYSLGPATALNSFDYRDVAGGTYDLAIRTRGVGGRSNWVYLMGFVMGADLDNPAPPTNLHCKDDPVNEYFTGPDCEIVWDASIGSDYTVPTDPNIPFDGAIDVGVSNVTGYKIQVFDGTDLVRTHISEGRDILTWSYTLAMNAEDNGTPIRNLNFRVYTLALGDKESLTYAALSASNPAPSMSSIVPTVLGLTGHLDISWQTVSDNDMLAYEVWVDGIKEKTVPHPDDNYKYPDVEVGTSYTVQIIPVDQFGSGTGSLTNSGSPVTIPAVNLDIELNTSMTKTDSDGNTAAELDKLYDGTLAANGVAYSLTGTDKWIEYDFGLPIILDRISVYTADANGQAYFALSDDGSSWSYFKAEADHTLTDDHKLIAASDQADGRTNYWQFSAGHNLALMPNNIVTRYVRTYLTGTYSTTIYELIPARILIGELAAIRFLSSISANIGEVIAGLLRSGDGNFWMDLDNKQLKYLGNNISIISGENDRLDWEEDSTAYTATLTAGTTYTPETLAAHVQTLMRAVGDADTTVTYNATTKKITIENDTLTTLELHWFTGTNTEQTCGGALGFEVSADDTGEVTYEADKETGLLIALGFLL